jgi:Tol biopolymer transport system component
MTQSVERQGIMALAPGETKEKELSWLDWSGVTDMSSDGRFVLFTESGSGGGEGYSIYLRKTDGSPAVRVAEGFSNTLSPDGKWALGVSGWTTDRPTMSLYPTGPGQPRSLATKDVRVQFADWMPDGKQILFEAREPGRGVRVYLMDIESGKYKAVTPEGYRIQQHGISPDGRVAVLNGPDRKPVLYPVAGGEPTPLDLQTTDRLARWTTDGKALIYHQVGELPTKLYRLELASGRKEVIRSVMPADAAGVANVGRIALTPDLSSYVYSFTRILSDLYVVDGLK